jgi:hypothetical protein
MNAQRAGRYVESLIGFVVLHVGRLSLAQYQITCIVCIVLGTVCIYSSMGEHLIIELSTDAREELQALENRRDLHHRQILELDARLHEVRRIQSEPYSQLTSTRQDLVQTIDRASRQNPVQVLGVQATGPVAFGTQGARQRHQVVLRGYFSEITAFIRDISEQHSTIMVVEVEVKSPEWSYPEQPLQAILSVEAGLNDEGTN